MRNPSTSIRADQLLVRYGYCTRRLARRWIKAGRVTTPHGPILSPDTRVDPSTVCVDGEPVPFPNGLFIALNKPTGYVCSHAAADGVPVYRLLPAEWLSRSPVPGTIGRLDRDTSGLLLITDLGWLQHALSAPGRGVAKRYRVRTDRALPKEIAPAFASGKLVLAGETRPCLPAELHVCGEREARVTLFEGRHRQVRRMFAAFGVEVIELHRLAVGPYTLDGLATGSYRILELPHAPADDQARGDA